MCLFLNCFYYYFLLGFLNIYKKLHSFLVMHVLYFVFMKLCPQQHYHTSYCCLYNMHHFYQTLSTIKKTKKNWETLFYIFTFIITFIYFVILILKPIFHFIEMLYFCTVFVLSFCFSLRYLISPKQWHPLQWIDLCSITLFSQMWRTSEEWRRLYLHFWRISILASWGLLVSTSN